MTDQPAATFACAQCGSPVPASSQFCLACGTPVSSRSRATALGAASAASASGAPGTAGTAGAAYAGDDWRPQPVRPPLDVATLVPANYGRRVGAFIIDAAIGTAVGAILAGILAALGLLTVRGAFFADAGVLLLLFAGYLLYPLVMLLMQAFLGYSVGKRIVGLRIVAGDTFGKPGLVRMIVRDLIVAAASLVFGIGQLVVYLSPLWDNRHLGLGWHDKVARTWVIDVRQGPNPLLPSVGTLEGAAPTPAVPANGVAPAPTAAPTPPLSSAPEPALPSPAAEQLLAPVITTVPGFGPPPTAAVPASESTASDSPAAASTSDSLASDSSSSDSTAADDEIDVDSTRLSNSQRSARASRTGLALRLDTGEFFVIDRAGVLGRDPVSPRGAESGDLAIQVPGVNASVSKTHLEFGVVSGPEHALWVSDRGSTNGSTLTKAGTGMTSRLNPGDRVTVRPGDTVAVGTRSFTVEGAQ